MKLEDLYEYKWTLTFPKENFKHMSIEWKLTNDLDGKRICCVEIYPAEQNGDIHFEGLWVDPQYRNQGLASQIVTLCKEQYKCNAVDVRPNNEIALHLYRKHGFVVRTSEGTDAAGNIFYTLHL